MPLLQTAGMPCFAVTALCGAMHPPLQYGEDQEVKTQEHGDMADPDSDEGPDY